MSVFTFSGVLLILYFSGVLSSRIPRDIDIYSEEDGSDEILVVASTILPVEIDDVATSQVESATSAEANENPTIQTEDPNPPETNGVTLQPEEPQEPSQPEKPETTLQPIEPDRPIPPAFIPFDPRIRGLNIGLSSVLLDLNRRLIFTRRVPLELVIKVLVLSSKIERLGGEVNEVNRDMMRIIPPLLPEAFKAAACTSFLKRVPSVSPISEHLSFWNYGF
ncbi:uncharacterized protein LOC118193668 [Stegodyphus dumicola]|uniref:uncharacterized protein LOC118193668 n=1 Tax=Stegodyphus dumicola TaxID=202533 RepID=UPI0015A7D467|nr:uncharacterized protein LOC118193668 [Stegodyphus dumicola]